LIAEAGPIDVADTNSRLIAFRMMSDKGIRCFWIKL